jgi:hypothetical protein
MAYGLAAVRAKPGNRWYRYLPPPDSFRPPIACSYVFQVDGSRM